MAKSLAHAWGQVMGGIFESTFYDMLSRVADEEGVYLDYNGNDRAADCGVRSSGGKLAWRDQDDNWHQLDFVFERGGTEGRVGVPLAFVEIAWRRYTKHSKNKAQEIEGALLPIAQAHRHLRPFLGAIAGGVFTKPSITQLTSRGLTLIYVPYADVVDAFASVGIDADYGEHTKESEYKKKLAAFQKLSPAKRLQLQKAIVASAKKQIGVFVKSLRASIARQVVAIVVLPLHGESKEIGNLADAIAFISGYTDDKGSRGPVVRYDVEVRFSNGAAIKGEFPTKAEATAFLRSLE